MKQSYAVKKNHEKIVERMKALGTYKPEFEMTIQRTAALYVQKEEVEKAFIASGGDTVIMYTNKAGATNPAKNPFIVARDDIYSQLLAHERELGLTPAALKKINEASMKQKKTSVLADALAKLS